MRIARKLVPLVSLVLLLALIVLAIVTFAWPTERVWYYGQVLLARDMHSQSRQGFCVAFPYLEPLRTLNVLVGRPTAICFDTQWEANKWFQENIRQP